MPDRTGPQTWGFVVSEAQFDRMFPDRDPFFTYDGLLAATASYPAFARTRAPVVRRQEAAFLANVSHETGGLVYLRYWNAQTGPGTMTGHDAMVGYKGFGETIRSLPQPQRHG